MCFVKISRLVYARFMGHTPQIAYQQPYAAQQIAAYQQYQQQYQQQMAQYHHQQQQQQQQQNKTVAVQR